MTSIKTLWLLLVFRVINLEVKNLGHRQEIEEFCEVNYGVSFLISEKIDVKGVTTPFIQMANR